MLTRIDYLYRDASNYKAHNEIYVNGIFTDDQKQRIIASLEGREYFIPRAVGWPEIRISSDYNEDDHCWFELHYNDFLEVCSNPWHGVVIDKTHEQIVNDFVSAKWHDWENEWLMDV